MSAGAVCFDRTVAEILASAGIPVVLCGPCPLADVVTGRICVLVGDPEDPAAEAAAVAMAAELFGPDPLVVHSPAEARVAVRALSLREESRYRGPPPVSSDRDT